MSETKTKRVKKTPVVEPVALPVDHGCTRCPLHEAARHVCIGAVGPDIGAQLMFVGQNPGYNEDAVGLPFIGAAGEQLDALLREAGIDRTRVAISNAVKCLTIGNREPTIVESKKCRPYLVDEVRRLRPKLIVALGNTALRALTGASGITKARGQLLDAHRDYQTTAKVLPTFHPAAALYAPKFLAYIKEDFRRARAAIEGSFSDVEVKHVIYAGGDLDLTPDTTWAFDIETVPAQKQRITMLGIDDGKTVVVFPPEHMPTGVLALKTAPACGVELVGHNASMFDDVHIGRQYGVRVHPHDTMLAAHLLDEEAPKSLEDLACSHLGVRPWKRDFVEVYSSHDPGYGQLAEYNAKDCRYTLQLWQQLAPKLRADAQLWRLYEQLMLPASRALSWVSRNGVYVSPARVLLARTELSARRDLHLEVLRRYAHDFGIEGFNPNSPDRVATLLYDFAGIYCQKVTKSGARSTDEQALKLARLNAAHPALDATLGYRKATKLLTYVDKLDRQPDAHGRVYSSYTLAFVVTGRTSAPGKNIDNGISIQTIPRDPLVRSCASAAPGKVLVAADYSQMELRIGAFVFQDRGMLAAFADRAYDPHMQIAMRMTGKAAADVTYEERARAKPVSFGSLYGAEWQTLQMYALQKYDIVYSDDEASALRGYFFDMWQGADAAYRRIYKEMRETGQVRSPIGRVRRLPNVHSNQRGVRTEALREGVNAPIQGFASDCALIALMLAVGRGWDVVIFNHDQIVVECSPERSERCGRELREIMEEDVPYFLKSRFDVDLTVPLVADVKIGPHWA